MTEMISGLESTTIITHKKEQTKYDLINNVAHAIKHRCGFLSGIGSTAAPVKQNAFSS
jgi:hypothetical protein